MAEVNPDDLSNLVVSSAKLLQTIDTMKLGVVILLITLVVIVLAFVLLGRWMYMRQQAEQDKKKQARANALSGALDRLSTCMADSRKDSREDNLRLTASLDTVSEVTSKMETSITVLVQRASGQMTKSASLRHIKRQFTKEVAPAICVIFERSLAENHYATRKTFVVQRVKTAVGEVLIEARQDMRSAPLAFSPDVFFHLDDDESKGERFVLCDRIWKSVEPLYLKETPLKDRTEEAALAIKNIIADYVDTIIGELQTSRPLVGQDEMFRGTSSGLHGALKSDTPLRSMMTPLPGSLGKGPAS